MNSHSYFLYHFRAMRWTQDHEIVFLRQVLLFEPWQYKTGSSERGKVWEMLSDTLNANTTIYFKVTARSLRDHLRLKLDQFKRKMKNEEKASGIDPPEMSEEDIALEDITEKFDEAEVQFKLKSQEIKDKQLNDNNVAIEIRKRSLETMGETSQRSGEEDSSKKRRTNGSETIAYLQEKSQADLELKRAELALKKEKNDAMMQAQQQQQQVMMMMQAQQQQNQQMIALIDKIANAKNS